jgi:hypothetical protein
VADHKALQEQRQFQHESEWHEAKIESYHQDTKERKSYANKIFWLLACFLGGAFFLLLVSALPKSISVALQHVPQFTHVVIDHGLYDGVLIALIGGTTANVIGLFAIVASYLFPKKPNDPS